MPNAFPTGRTRTKRIRYEDSQTTSWSQVVTGSLTRMEPIAPIRPRSIYRPRKWTGACGMSIDPVDVRLQWVIGKGTITAIQSQLPPTFRGDSILWLKRQGWQMILTGEGISRTLDDFEYEWDDDDEYAIDNMEPSQQVALYVNVTVIGQPAWTVELAGLFEYEVELEQRSWANPRAEWDGYEWEEYVNLTT